MNNSQKFKMTLFIVIFILLIALVIYAIVGTNDDREYYKANGVMPTNSSEVIAEEETTPVATMTPVVITIAPTPTPTPVPTPTPTPTPVPTPTPLPAGTELARGSVTSPDDNLLRMRADYVATVLDDNHVEVKVDVTAIHYSLYYSSFKALNITLNDDSQWLDVPAINSDYNGITETPIGSYTFTVEVPSGTSSVLNLNVKWNFNGSYGNKEIQSIDCDSQISIVR